LPTARHREIEIPEVWIPTIKTHTIKTTTTTTKGELYNSRLQREQLLAETMEDRNAPIIANHDDEWQCITNLKPYRQMKTNSKQSNHYNIHYKMTTVHQNISKYLPLYQPSASLEVYTNFINYE